MVVFSHFYRAMHDSYPDGLWFVDFTPLSLLVAGRFAVILFFVLSGFVLALPYFNGSQRSYSQYIAKRICRIYLPFAATVFVAALLCHVVAEPQPFIKIGTMDSWTQPVDVNLLMSHLTMTGIQKQSISLNPSIWSLIIEMRVSLIFPLLVMLVIRFGWIAVFGGLIVGFAATKLAILVGGHHLYTAETPLASLLLTMRYVPFFLFGVIAAHRLEQLKSLLLRLPKHMHMLFILIAVLLHSPLRLSTYVGPGDVWYTIIAVYLILCCVTFAKTNAMLSVGAFKWLGKVSYSLYLIHLPIIFSVFYLLHDTASHAVIFAVALLLILLAAEIMYALIEQPSIQLGKILAERLSPHPDTIAVTDDAAS
jgi:peptidoglycan/LPS O-acetylase OafA/YrhL